MTVLRLARRRHIATSRSALRWWVVLGAIIVVAGLTWISTDLLLAEADLARDRAQARIEAIKTGLSVGGGTAAVFALLLATRRQWHHEIATIDTNVDATERRVTELYARAADQLGSDKAPVRLAGLYALERLAQGNPSHRQTIVEVLCAYLRMPYEVNTLLGEVSTENDPQLQPGRSDAATPDVVMDKDHEYQVRRTAQQILVNHLRPPGQGPEGRVLDQQYWHGIDLDLVGATLLDFDFSGCSPRQAFFRRARFHGGAWFTDARFQDKASFSHAIFTGYAGFGGAEFGGAVSFTHTLFSDDAWFAQSTFTQAAFFNRTRFSGMAAFDQTNFSADVQFHQTSFAAYAGFSRLNISGNLYFAKAEFGGSASFASPRSEIRGNILLASARARSGASGSIWPEGWELTTCANGWCDLMIAAEYPTEPTTASDRQ